MPRRKTLKPTNRAKAAREKLALEMAQVDKSIKEQEAAIQRLRDTVDRWILVGKAMVHTRDIAVHYRAQLQRQFDQG